MKKFNTAEFFRSSGFKAVLASLISILIGLFVGAIVILVSGLTSKGLKQE